jgi:hypothetical protein
MSPFPRNACTFLLLAFLVGCATNSDSGWTLSESPVRLLLEPPSLGGDGFQLLLDGESNGNCPSFANAPTVTLNGTAQAMLYAGGWQPVNEHDTTCVGADFFTSVHLDLSQPITIVFHDATATRRAVATFAPSNTFPVPTFSVCEFDECN